MQHDKPKAPASNSIKDWIEFRLPIFALIDGVAGSYPAPRNLSYWWNFGSLAILCLAAQIITGVFLAMHYTPESTMAFTSVNEHIMRDVNYGWLLRYAHAVGASLFFAVVYIHLFRGIYYGSYKYPRELLWWLGLVILLLMMATAFMGYVLPWGQMSFWGATVITNFFSAIPIVGEKLLIWLRGDYSVGNATLNRFFALHYLLPFVIVAVVALHIWALHQHGSNNPLGIDVKGPQDTVPFNPYYTIKDMFGMAVFLILFSYLVFFKPDALGDPDNFIPANPMATPAEIVPEWYFLPFYAILRSVPDKLGGVLAMFGSIMLLFFLPWLDTSKVRSARFRPWFKWVFWLLVIDCLVLGYAGGHSADWGTLVSFKEKAGQDAAKGITLVFGSLAKYIPDISIPRIAALYYFFHFFVLTPYIARKEKPLPLPESISVPVLKTR